MSGKTIRYAFVRSLPIMCSYFFISLAYGITMAENGFAWYYSLLASVTVYTGAFQFVLITFLSSGASLLTVALTALLMNSRQSFYSLQLSLSAINGGITLCSAFFWARLPICSFSDFCKREAYLITVNEFCILLTIQTEWRRR